MKFSKWYLFLMIIISHNFLSAQNTYEFLRIDVSSKVSALGGSFTAN